MVDGQLAFPGQVLVTQRGTQFHPGHNVGLVSDGVWLWPCVRVTGSWGWGAGGAGAAARAEQEALAVAATGGEMDMRAAA